MSSESCTDEQWCEAAIKLEQNPSINKVEASIPRRGWMWCVVRTDINGVFLKNTYFNGNIVTSSSINVYVESRHLRCRNTLLL